MKSLRSGLTVSLFLFAFWPAARADASIVYGNLGAEDTYDTLRGVTVCNDLAPCFAEDWDVAVGFVLPTDSPLISVSLPVGLLSGTNVLDVFLETDFPCQTTAARACGPWGGVPSDDVIESFRFTNAMGMFGLASPLLVANSTLNPILRAGTLYWIVADGLDGSGFLAAWNFPLVQSSGPAAARHWGGQNDSLWYAVGPQPGFKVTVPEPTSLTLLGLGLAGLLRRLRCASPSCPRRTNSDSLIEQ